MSQQDPSGDLNFSPNVKPKFDIVHIATRVLVVVLVLESLIVIWQFARNVLGKPPTVDVQTLHLAGQLLITLGNEGVAEMDMPSGRIKTLFDPPPLGQVNSAALSPDGSTIVLAYAAPAGAIQLGFTDLYRMPADGSRNPVLLLAAGDGNLLYNPAWSPDGRTLYYSRIQSGAFGTSVMDVMQMSYPFGEPQALQSNAHAPDVSNDGTQITLVTFDVFTSNENLSIVDLKSGNVTPVLNASKFTTIDNPRFSHDGKLLIFSSPTYKSASLSQPEADSLSETFDTFLGIHTALAHSVPSFLWIVTASGGEPKRLTRINEYGITADFSPDDQHIAFASSNGIYVMNTDGSDLVRISTQINGKSLQWIP